MKQFCPQILLVILLQCSFTSLFCLDQAPANAEDAPPSTPDLTIMIPMRDGVALATDLYLPYKGAENLPCILVRSPTGKERQSDDWFSLVKEGYVLAVQETRSVSHKEILPYITDAWGQLQDGYDTVQWLKDSKWTNGKIGTVGRSAFGITQLLLAPTAPDALKCQFIEVASPSLHEYTIFPGGGFRKNQVEGWLGNHQEKDKIVALMKSKFSDTAFWEQFNSIKNSKTVSVPAVHKGGWYDTFSQGTLDAFVARNEHGAEGAKGKQKLIMGPWHHLNHLSNAFGDFELLPQMNDFPANFSYEKWFAQYLKGEKPQDETPNVAYYVMGPFDGSPSKGNVWKTASTWPIPARETPIYLTKKSSLEFSPNKKNSDSFFSFQSDPENPVPTTGGRNLFLPSGPKDQQSIETRDDVILFTSGELKKDLEITGRILAQLYLSSDSDNSNVVMRLCDVYPDGKSILIAEGFSKINNAKNAKQPITVDLWSTSMVFAKGHRLRISVSSSSYPQFDLEISKDHSVATNRIHLGGNKPSKIVLPIIL